MNCTCAVPDCSFSSHPDCVLIRFPENAALRERWEQAIEFGSGLLTRWIPSGEANKETGTEWARDLALCSWHFEDKSFSDYQEPSMFVDRDGNLMEICSCRVCLQFHKRNEMVSKDSKLGRKTVSILIKKILGITLTEEDFLLQICEECLVKLDICLNWIQNAKTAEAQFNELAVAARNEKMYFLESENSLVELCQETNHSILDQDFCVDEFIEAIQINHDSKYIAFEVEFLQDPNDFSNESKCDVEFVAVTSDETDLLQEEESMNRRRGPGRPRKRHLPVVVEKQDFKDILSRKCYICNTLLSSNNDLIGHLTNHATNTDYQCKECGGKTFNKVSSYNHHLSFHDLENRPFKCDRCELGFSTVQSLKGHQNREHGANHVLRKPKRRTMGKSYQCDTCGKTFKSCYQLREHDNYYHKKMYTAVCTVCSKAFPTKSLLLKHYIVHSGEKPYKCDWCGEAYKNSTCLDRHVLKHKSDCLKRKREKLKHGAKKSQKVVGGCR